MAIILGEGVFALELEMNGSSIYPALLWNEQDGATLIDTGMVGMLGQLQEAVRQAGVEWNDIRRVILTHQDIDHIGNLPAIVSSLPSKPEIWAHQDDAPVIEGKQPLLKMSKERLAAMPDGFRQVIEGLFRDLTEIKVDKLLQDGEILPLQGNIQVIHTPGHTPGHLCFYISDDKLLLAADELRVENGELAGPNEPFTPDMPLALKSMAKLEGLALIRVLCYHGGVYDRQPEQAIRKLANSAK